MANRHQKRETDGRYAHQGNWDRLCTCGHTLGVHACGSPADCLLYSLSAAERAEELARPEQINKEIACGCTRFKLSRRKPQTGGTT